MQQSKHENQRQKPSKVLVLLHGWMGSKSEWEECAQVIKKDLPDWKILSFDLPGHGDAFQFNSKPHQVVRSALQLDSTFADEEEYYMDFGIDDEINIPDVDSMANAVITSLNE